jgi:CubicO group peptidase (beta-lactamase class C family)
MNSSPLFSFSPAISRRTFLGAVGFGALSLRSLAQEAAPTTMKRIAMPSEVFGTISPAAAGFSDDVTAKISTYLKAQIAAGVIPGACVAAMRHGKVFLEEHFGVYCSRTDHDAPYDGAVLHPYHSCSKMVSATVVMLAAQDGLVDIDAPVMKYIPEFGNNGKEVITIRQLMSHGAGIPKDPLKHMIVNTEAGWQTVLAAICAMPLQWAPGSRTEYHGFTGMFIAAEAVRRGSNNKPWQQICQERLFTPLGMSTFTFDEPPLDAPLACIGRLPNPAKQWKDQVDHFGDAPAAGIKGSLADLLKLVKFHSEKGVWEGKTLLQEKYWTDMHTLQYAGKPAPAAGQPGFQNWGLGMMLRGTTPTGDGWFGLRNLTNPHIFSHAGTDIALAVGDPDSDTQIALILTDSPKTKPEATDIRNTMTDTIFTSLQKTA